jgi:hypothetical protein
MKLILPLITTKNQLWVSQYKTEFPVYADFSKKLEEVYKKSNSDKDFSGWLQEEWDKYRTYFYQTNTDKTMLFLEYVESKEALTSKIFSYNKQILIVVGVAAVIFVIYKLSIKKNSNEK